MKESLDSDCDAGIDGSTSPFTVILWSFEEYVKGGDGFDPRCPLIERFMKIRPDKIRVTRRMSVVLEVLITKHA